jgi:hypothetical protein
MSSGFNDRTCTNGKGGIKSVILFPIGSIATGPTLTNNEITTLTVTGEVFQYKLKSNLSSYTAPILASDTKELRAEIHLLGQNEVVAIVEKADGTYVALGLDEGLQINDGSEYTSGVIKSDRNGHSIVLAGLENNEVPDVAAGIVATLLTQQSPVV